MRIEEDFKIDFNNVLIRPKRSTLTSRRDVDLHREYTFRHSSIKYRGIPVIAANMDGVGTFSVAKVFQKYDLLTAIRKHYSLQDWENAVNSGLKLDNVMVCSGSNAIFDSSAEDYIRMNEILKRWPEINFICIDVANGYQENFVDFAKRIRDENVNKIIVAGNVCTPEMTEELIISGVDIVKVGIGPGCFTPNSMVRTKIGLKPISDVNVGDSVLTHKARYKSVTNKFIYSDKKELVVVNGIHTTPNHEFYVLHRKYINLVNDDNIDEYAEWVAAKNLSKEYLLLEINNV